MISQEVVDAFLIPGVLVFSMLGMGMTLSVRDFASVFKTPRAVLLGLGFQMLLVPLLALAFTTLTEMSAGWAVGLLLVSVVPGGAFSNLMTYFGRGNVPLSISLTVSATVMCVLTTPLILGVIASAHLPSDFHFPVLRIVTDIVLYLLTPLILGMVVHRLYDKSEERSKIPIRIAVVFLVLITISSLGSGRIKVGEYGIIPPLLITSFGIALSIIIPLLTRALGQPDRDTVAIGIEVVVRNVGVALLLFPFFFPGREEQGHVLYTCLYYSGMSGFVALTMLLRHRAGKSPLIGFAPRP